MDPDQTASPGDLCQAAVLMFAHARDRGRGIDEQAPLPQSEARRRVEGGAPLPLLNCTGAPSYSPDRFDTRLTHPLAGHMAIANAEAMALRDFYRRGQEPW